MLRVVDVRDLPQIAPWERYAADAPRLSPLASGLLFEAGTDTPATFPGGDNWRDWGGR